MFDRVLRRLRARIESGDYVVTTHAHDEMDDDGLSVFDLERIKRERRARARKQEVSVAEFS